MRPTYAIALDLDQDSLSKEAYEEIQRALQDCGFTRKLGSIYFGNETIDPVKCVLSVQKLSSKFSWFSSSVRNIRMLRIEDDCDLSLATKGPN